MREVVAPLRCFVDGLWLSSETDEGFQHNEDPRGHEQWNEYVLPKETEHPAVAHVVLCTFELWELVCGKKE